MPWRPFHIARLSFVSAPTPVAIYSFRRAISSVTKATNNIASILALPEAAEHLAPRTIEVTAHVRTIRNQKRHSFVELGDGSTTASLQALLEPAQATG